MGNNTLASRRAVNNLRAATRIAAPPVAVTDAARVPDPAAMAEALPRGTVVIFRHYESPDRTGLGRCMAAVCRRRGLVLLVAGDHRLAAALGADGLHLPEGLARHGVLSPALLWLRKRNGLLTAAAHGPAALARAARLGADAALLSPVFPTASHPGAATLGPWRFSLTARRARLPVIALGGMSARRMARLGHAAGWAGVPKSLDRGRSRG